MPDQSKPKITIDDDGTIHVDNGENNSRSTTKAKSSKNNVGNRSSGASSKPTPLKTSAQIADEGLSDSSSAASKAKSRLDSSNQHTITEQEDSSQQQDNSEFNRRESLSTLVFYIGIGIIGFGMYQANPPVILVGVVIFFLSIRIFNG